MLTSRSLAFLIVPVFVLLAVIAALALRLSQDEKTSQEFVDHTFRVIVATQRLLSDAQAAQIALRGYESTGRDVFAGRVRAGVEAVPGDLESFRRLTIDNPNQRRRAALLKPVVEDWSALVEKGIELARTTGSSPVLFAAEAGQVRTSVADTGAKIDQIRVMSAAAAEEEYRLLDLRTRHTRFLERSTFNAALLGTILAFLILGAAIWLLVRNNARLAESEAVRARQANILQATLDSIREGIAVFDADKRLAAFNANFFRLAALPPQLAAIGTPLDRLLASEGGREDKFFPAAPLSPEGGTRRLVISGRTLDVYATEVPNEGALVAVADVTARVRSEEALRQAQKMEAVGHLTGGIAHDFNNLLQIVSANLDLAGGENASDPRLAARLRNAMAAVERGARLTAQLLAFARRQALEPRVINPSRLMQDMTELLRRTLGERIEIESIVAGGLWNTLVDPNQVQNALLNLAINARDAMADGGGGKLTIEASNAFLDDDYAAEHAEVAAGQYVMIAVTDTGTGMAPETLARVFDPFFTTKPEGQGTGLGLSQVYGFVKQSGGHVKIYSEIGHGTTVKLYLPRTRKAREHASPVVDLPVRGGHETILVVEDDEDVRAAVADMLGELGYKVLLADSAERALAVLRSGAHVDLLFSDVVMPGSVPTRELARSARELNSQIKILFTSGYTQNAIVHNGRLDDDVFLLSKPYRKHDLARKLRSLLADTKGGGAKAETPAAPKKALIVDDIALVRMTTADMVGEIGLRAVEAGDGHEALALLMDDGEIDVLVTDLGLPGLSGSELIREARRHRPSLRIVIASGYSRETLQGEDVPPDAVFLSKPFTAAQIQRAIFGG